MRNIFLMSILLLGTALLVAIGLDQLGKDATPTLAPFFQLAGKSTETLDSLFTRIVPVNALDEKKFGDVISQRLSQRSLTGKDVDYVNELIKNMGQSSKKPFTYRVFIIDCPIPNACSMPGGVIYLNSGLLKAMESESELVSILAHEMGHIELEHCFKTVKYELLSRKITHMSLGKIADLATQFLLRHSFSKTQEADADQYAFQFILSTKYDPRGVSKSFTHLQTARNRVSEEEKRIDILRDYLSSHPPIKIRIAKYSEQARMWWEKNKGHSKYIGKTNLDNRMSFYSNPLNSEWVVE